MEQHPVPQPISSYEFRLIGSMTLKQFAKLGANCLVALIFYALPLPTFLKWPLIFFFVILGVGMAFVPFNERPLDVWITSFFKKIFSPTQYLWRKDLTNLPPTSYPLKKTPVQKTSPLPFQTVRPLPPSPPVQQTEKVSLKSSIPQTPEKKEEEYLKVFQSLFTSTPSTKPKIILKPQEPLPKPVPVQAKFTKENFPPFVPTTPNVISGMIKDEKGRLIEGAILEIKDANGLSVRALKSNKLGQFRTATPLANGIYEIYTEKEGYDFDIIKMELKGEIVPLIEISSK